MTEAVPPGVDLKDIQDAAERLAETAIRTPLLECHELNELTGGQILLKAESLQRTGSFKFRGAYNKISQLDPRTRAQGVLAWSSGNHAQGVAAAARILSTPATIVMPADAPAIKIDNTRALGAEVVLYDRYNESREEIGSNLATKRNLTIVPPYDDSDIIAGQGTVGLEITEQCRDIGITPDALLINCSGGGLAAGCATAMCAQNPGVEIHTVEPAGFNDMAKSLSAGERQINAPGNRSICDALLAPTPGEITFPIARGLLASGIEVTDANVRDAIRFAYRSLKLVIEPGGAAALAAILDKSYDARGKCVCLVLTGGNISADLFAEIIAE